MTNFVCNWLYRIDEDETKPCWLRAACGHLAGVCAVFGGTLTSAELLATYREYWKENAEHKLAAACLAKACTTSELQALYQAHCEWRARCLDCVTPVGETEHGYEETTTAC